MSPLTTLPKLNNFKVKFGRKTSRVESVDVSTGTDPSQLLTAGLTDAEGVQLTAPNHNSITSEAEFRALVNVYAGSICQSAVFDTVSAFDNTFDHGIQATVGAESFTWNVSNHGADAVAGTGPHATRDGVGLSFTDAELSAILKTTGTVRLTLKTAAEVTDVVTLEYKTKSKDQSKGVIEDLSGNDLQSIKGIDVVNITDQDTIDAQNIFHTTHTYHVDTDVVASASSWTADIKVKAVAAPVNTTITALAQLTATKTESLSAFAVARLFIDETKSVSAAMLPSVQYPYVGVTSSGKTFWNGLRNDQNRFGGLLSSTIAVRGSGIGQAFASAEGYWTKTSVSGELINAMGAIRGIVAQTTTQYEKGDFSFLQLTATSMVGVSINQKLVYNDITQATIRNRYAEYRIVKDTDTANLFDMNFGTANFRKITTGKAYMVLTELEDKTLMTMTLPSLFARATARVTLSLDDHFEAWVKDTFNGTLFVTAKGFTRTSDGPAFGHPFQGGIELSSPRSEQVTFLSLFLPIQLKVQSESLF